MTISNEIVKVAMIMIRYISNILRFLIDIILVVNLIVV